MSITLPSGEKSDVAVPNYARHIGRVGALAVALGIGVAITNNAGIAVADTTGASSAASSSTASSPTAGESSPSGTSSSSRTASTARTSARTARKSAVKEPSGSTATVLDDSSTIQPTDTLTSINDGAEPNSAAESPDTANSGTAATESTEAPGSEPESTNPTDPTVIVEPPAVPVTPDPPSSVTSPTVIGTATNGGSNNRPRTVTGAKTASRPAPKSASVTATAPMAITTVTGETSATGTDAVAAPTGIRADSSVEDTALTTTLAASTAIPAAAGPLHAVLAGVTQWITGLTHTANSPVAPPHAPTLWALLGWVRRQIEYTFFNSGPTIQYNPSANVAGFNSNTSLFNGIIVGDLGLDDAEGDKLTVKVTKLPSGGTVTINPNGTFTYTPSATTAAVGYVDTFQVTVSDSVGNPPHINLLKLFSPNFGGTITKTIRVNVQPTSPLGTPDQIAMEIRAKDIMATSQMKEAMATVRAQWLAAAQDGLSKAGGVDAVNMALLDQAVYEYFYAGALNAQNSDPLNPKVLTYDVAPHTWFGHDIPGSRVIYDNPDGIYRTIPVEINSSYVIRGQWFGTKPSDTNFSLLNVRGQTLANLAQKDIVVNADGTFTITVSADAANGNPNHIQLTDGATNFLIRDTLSDWSTELPMSLTVERVSGAIVTPLTNEELAAKAVGQLLAASPGFNVYMRAATRVNAFDPTSPLRDPNVFAQPAPFGDQTLVTQWPSYGYFQLQNDQALVLTFDPGSSGYWVFPVSNDWETTNTYSSQQTTLNNTQAIANSDGTYTVVLSPSDPRIANWVSTGTVMVDLDGDGVKNEETVHQGTVQIRFQQIADAANGPRIVSQQVVSLDQLDSVLPPDAVYLTPEQRAEQLAERNSGFDASRWASPDNFRTV